MYHRELYDCNKSTWGHLESNMSSRTTHISTTTPNEHDVITTNRRGVRLSWKSSREAQVVRNRAMIRNTPLETCLERLQSAKVYSHDSVSTTRTCGCSKGLVQRTSTPTTNRGIPGKVHAVRCFQ